METIHTLGSLMGLAFLSGLRLYSTVFVLGLGTRLGLLHLPESLGSLRVLAATPILVMAGALFIIEFFADKVPWLDTLWDAVHTFIRPLGAAVLAATALGDVSPTVKVGAFLLAGATALSGHAAKMSTRLVANHSPEPFSNIGLSVAEDGVVVTGAWLALRHPVVALIVVLILIALIIWLLPRILGMFRRNAARVAELFRTRPADHQKPTP